MKSCETSHDLTNQFSASYLRECIARGRSDISFSDFGQETKQLYSQLLKTDLTATRRICSEVDIDFCRLHKNDLEKHLVLRDALTLHATDAYKQMRFRPTVLHFIFDRQGRLLFIKSRKAKDKNKNNWSLVQGDVGKGEDILTASRREVCAEECSSMKCTDLENYRFLGAKDIEFKPGREHRDGFSEGKRYIVISVDYSGAPEIDADPKEIDKCEWVDSQDIQNYLSTMRRVKQQFLIEKLLLIPKTRTLAMGLLDRL